MWDVELAAIKPWLNALSDADYNQVMAAIELLAERGPQLGRPLVDSIASSRHSNMKELRPGATGKSAIRVLFAFDRERRGILLLAGDKSGNWKGWYAENIPLADDLFDRHLELVKDQNAPKGKRTNKSKPRKKGS